MATQTTILDEEGQRDTPEQGGLHLLVMSPGSFATFPLPKAGALKIGRTGRSDIRLEDPLVSREHAVLHVAEGIFIEDLGSANGTRVREGKIAAGERVAVSPGEGVTIGDTVLMVQNNRARAGHQQLLSHGYFEGRVAGACERHEGTAEAFAVVRLRLEEPAPWTEVAPLFARELPAGCAFAVYAPDEYEILVTDRNAAEVEALVAATRSGLEALGVSTRVGVAWFPADGRTVDALIARGNALVRPRRRVPDNAKDQDYVLGPAMQTVQDLATRAAATNIKVLILGENGVGKDVLARMVHELSPRHDKPFLALNCGGFAESLIESELFGYERGAFTGAVQAKPGLFESADGGTVFLDEIGELSPTMQVRLLQVLQTRQVRRLGNVKERTVDVRFIAATNRDLDADVAAGRFREDLFYRINGMMLVIPPLRERRSEIEPLARRFVTELCADASRAAPDLGDDVCNLLRNYSWPGNVRELRNMMERALVVCDGNEIRPEHLPLDRMTAAAAARKDGGTDAETEPTLAKMTAMTAPQPALNLTPRQLQERALIEKALREHLWNETRAANAIDMPRSTFLHKMRAFGIPGSRSGTRR